MDKTYQNPFQRDRRKSIDIQTHNMRRFKPGTLPGGGAVLLSESLGKDDTTPKTT